MKIFGGIALGLGFLIIAGTAGASDFYEQCRAAADCVAGPAPMSDLEMTARLVIGLIMMVTGICMITKNTEF